MIFSENRFRFSVSRSGFPSPCKTEDASVYSDKDQT
jgi:hypothetical protein